MRILHGPKNPGGMAGLLARAQRQLGHRAWSVCYRGSSFGYQADETFASPLSDRSLGWFRFLLARAGRFDVFHFYFGQSLLGPLLWDVPWLKRMGKKVFFHFCGCDLRDAKRVIARGAPSACRGCWPMRCAPNRTRARDAARRYADAVFVSTPDLLEFLPGAELLPQPVDVEHLEAVAAEAGAGAPPGRPGIDRPVRVAHAPSDRAIKGTDLIVQAVERLRERGAAVELVLAEARSHAEALALSASCDLAVDQLLVGAYGQYAVEMMALGKPTICYLREDVRARYPPGCPVIPACPDDVEQVLADWAAHPQRWPDAARRGRRYVRQVHDKRVVARQCLRAYRNGRRR